MASPEDFDQELRAAVAPHCPDDQVCLQVGADVIWGLPLAPEGS
jgi:hypothetical protein